MKPDDPNQQEVRLPGKKPFPKEESSPSARLVNAPQPTGNFNEVPATRTLSVTVQQDEQVEWIWTALPSGGAYVSGYNIIK